MSTFTDREKRLDDCGQLALLLDRVPLGRSTHLSLDHRNQPSFCQLACTGEPEGRETGTPSVSNKQLIISIGAILLATRLFGFAFRFLVQPRVKGEIVAGIVLGRSVLGLFFTAVFCARVSRAGHGNVNRFEPDGIAPLHVRCVTGSRPGEDLKVASHRHTDEQCEHLGAAYAGRRSGRFPVSQGVFVLCLVMGTAILL